MTSDFGDRAIERDSSLVQGLCYTALNNQRDLHEWMEQELKALLFEAQIQESRLPEGVLKDRITTVIEDLRRTEGTELPEAIRRHKERREEIANGGYDDILDANDNLERETARLVAMARNLLQMREFIGAMGDS